MEVEPLLYAKSPQKHLKSNQRVQKDDEKHTQGFTFQS